MAPVPGLLSTRQWLLLLLEILVVIISINVAWSVTGPRQTLLGEFVLSKTSPLVWLIGSVTVLGGVHAARIWRKRYPEAWLGGSLLLFLLGIMGARGLYVYLDPPHGVPLENLLDLFHFIYNRSFFVFAIVPVAILAWLARRTNPFTLPGLGGTLPGIRLPGVAKYTPLLATILLASIPLSIFLIAFTPAKSFLAAVPLDTYLQRMPLLVAMALFNGFAEELVFRRYFLGVFSENLGDRTGNYLQALVFALLHFGASPNAISGLAAATVLFLLGAALGKLTLASGGIFLAILVHASLDFVFFSLQFG